MTTTSIHPAAAAYIKRLRRAACSLPKGARQDLLDDIEAHLDEATSVEMSEAEVLSPLDRLGEPEEIVAAQLPVRTESAAPAKGIHEWSAIILLLFGGFSTPQSRQRSASAAGLGGRRRRRTELSDSQSRSRGPGFR